MLSNHSKRGEAEQAVAKNEDETDDRSIKRMIRAARRFSGAAADDETPLTKEEERIMAEIRTQHRRPTQEEIREMARGLAARPKGGASE